MVNICDNAGCIAPPQKRIRQEHLPTFIEKREPKLARVCEDAKYVLIRLIVLRQRLLHPSEIAHKLGDATGAPAIPFGLDNNQCARETLLRQGIPNRPISMAFNYYFGSDRGIHRLRISCFGLYINFRGDMKMLIRPCVIEMLEPSTEENIDDRANECFITYL